GGGLLRPGRRLAQSGPSHRASPSARRRRIATTRVVQAPDSEGLRRGSASRTAGRGLPGAQGLSKNDRSRDVRAVDSCAATALVVDQLVEDKAVYNIPLVFECHGELDVEALQTAVRNV